MAHDEDHADDPHTVHLLDPHEELRKLRCWAGVNRCNRRAINRRLQEDPEQALDDEVEV